MFSSSSNGISPFSQVSPYLNWNPSTSSSPNNHENPSLFSNQEDLFSHCYISNSTPIIDTSSNNTPQITSNCRTKKQKTKKTDRHSKIFTAQGPRDRRVRLSIDVSKKFFGLQDLLGFDKASSTLDWLFNKSKTAITDLLRTNNIHSAKDTYLCSLSEEADDNAAASKETTSTSSKRKRKSSRASNRKPQIMNALDKVAKESREKARERARERTRVKISLRNILGALPEQKLPDLTSLYSPTSNCHWPGQIGSGKSTDSSRQITLTSSNEHTTDPVEGFFFVNPRTGEVNTHHQDRLFSESARIKADNKLDFNLWSYSVMNHHDLWSYSVINADSI